MRTVTFAAALVSLVTIGLGGLAIRLGARPSGRDEPVPTATTVKARRPRRGTIFASTSALVLTLLIGLGAIGVVHALWSKNLTVSGEVQTGDLNADWDKLRSHDKCNKTRTAEVSVHSNGVTTQTNGYDDGGGHDNDDGDSNEVCPSNPCHDGGNYAATGGNHDGGGGHDTCVPPPECDVSIGGVGGDHQFGNQVGYVDIKNATPGYWCEIEGWVSNTGTVPFNIIGIQSVLDAKNDEGLSFYDLTPHDPGDCKLLDKYGNTTTNRQVDPGKEGVVYCKVSIDSSVKTCSRWHQGSCKEWTYTGGAKDGWTYHFAVEVCVAQWNEEPSTGDASADFAACKHPPLGTHEGPDTPALPTPGPNKH